ncbi:MAG: hypothetical protein JWN86_2201 [Planctomycetota bacterium]|nr:hypothetical protein [Planctomycetota bacterium]
MLRVNLIVVSGKPEGKVIPLTLPVFRIGRDETCHLRPNSVEVSRQHTEITVTDTTVTVRDLGSRNGTLVNGNLVNSPHRLKSGELLKVGPLTFAVSIQEPANATAEVQSPNGWNTPPAPSKPPALDDMPQGQIESWLVADNARPTPDRPSGVYDGDTLTIDAYTGSGGQIPGRPTPAAKPPSASAQPTTKPPSSAAQPTAKPPSSAAVPVPSQGRFGEENVEFERLEEGAGDPDEETIDSDRDTDGGDEGEAVAQSEFLDESNPFYIAKKPKAEETAKKPSYTDTSDAANDILRKMLERRRASR